ncbi:hypothetical protein C8J57DRAFT_1722741 [Mycena rebaudengoi]|nr:hypothetical protein C8J57DRAFT_1722741 [Mycena rebaudengoi]
MSTSTVPMPSSSSSVPEVKIFARVADIPILAYCLRQASDMLSSNRYTAPPYSTAKGLSSTAYNYTAPYAAPLGPVISYADEYANKAVDLVQRNYPYPFEAKPEDVACYVRERRQSAVDYVSERRLSANKAIDEKVTTPVITVACGLDQRLTPLVNYFESTVTTRLHTQSAPADTKFQYQRVLVLSKNVTGQLYDYSNQTVLVQRASQTADSITALATQVATQANSRIHTLSDTLLVQLQNIQQATVSMQHATVTELNATISALRDIASTPDISLNERATRVGAVVQSRARPLLDRLLGARSDTPIITTIKGNGHAQ